MSRIAGALVLSLTLIAPPRLAAATPNDTSATLVRALAATEQRVGPSSPELLPILSPLAQLRYESGAFSEATELRRRSLRIAIANYGSTSVSAAEAMTALARLYIEQRRYLDAEPLAIVATGTLRDQPGKPSTALAEALGERARIALARGEPEVAERSAEEAIAIDKDNGGAPHGEHLRALGAALAMEGRLADSERALRGALAEARAKSDPLATARSLSQLANAYLRQKRFVEALPLIEEATAVDQDHLGPSHPLIAENFHDLGLVYLGLDRAGDAARALREALAVLDRGIARDTPTLAYVQLDLARAEHALGHEDEAQSLFGAARHILNAAEDEERDRQRQA